MGRSVTRAIYTAAAIIAGGLAPLCMADDYARVSGVVVDAGGAPVAGADVWAVRVELVPIGRMDTKTGADGNFALRLPPGRWKIHAKRGMKVGSIDEFYGSLRLAAGDVRDDLAIALRPGTRLYGTIRDKETGEPIPNAQLWIDDGVLLEADGEGRFEYEGLSRTDHKSYVIAPGYARERVLFDTTLREEAGFNIRAPRGGVLRGTVRDTDGNPIPNVRVTNVGSGSTIALQARITETDAEGRFMLPGLHYRTRHYIQADAAGFEEVTRQIGGLSPQAPEQIIDFVLRPEQGEEAEGTQVQSQRVLARPVRDVRGVVLEADGTPAVGASVRWITNALNVDPRSTKTSADGSFLLEGILNIQSMLMVMAEGHATAFVPVDADVTQGVEIALEPEQVIRGRVVDAGGAPLPRIRVIPRMTVVLENMRDTKWFRELAQTTDEDGRFVLTRLPKQNVSVDFLGRGVSNVRRRSLDPSKENVITMVGRGAIRGKVVGPDGLPVTDYKILVQPTHKPMPGKVSGSMFAGYTGIGIQFANPDGEFVVSDLTADRAHRVVAVAEGYSDAVQDPVLSYPLEQLPPAEQLLLRLGPPTPLRVRVTDWRTEKPIHGARVRLVDHSPDYDFSWGYDDQGWNRWIETTTGSGGEGRFPSAGMSEGTVIVRADGYGRRRLAWRGDDDALEVALEREGIVRGVAAGQDGKILPDGVVRLQDQEGNVYQADLTPVDKGEFHIGELPAGSYSLSISRDNQTLFVKDFDLGPGQVYDLAVDKLAVMRRPPPAVVMPERPQPLHVGDQAPLFAVERIGGGEVRLEDYRGKHVLLDFWATWCGPCIEETPHLKRVYEAFRDDDHFVMIGLSLDDSIQAPRDYAEANRMGWIQGFLGEWSKTPVPDAYGVWGIPTIFLIGPDGAILHQGLRGERILEAVEAALADD